MNTGVRQARNLLSTGARAGAGRAAESGADTLHIELRRVPHTTLPSDIRRALQHAQVQGVAEVALQYQHFKVADRALLTLSHPSYLSSALRALKNLTLCSLPVNVVPVNTKVSTPMTRTRGAQGRAEAGDRGAVTGLGPRGGLPPGGNYVTVTGLPPSTTVADFRDLLRGFKLAEATDQPDVVKVSLLLTLQTKPVHENAVFSMALPYGISFRGSPLGAQAPSSGLQA
ncbi:hypothetical protein HGRIS_013195 [Hohenbuehelia grisea]|uniref:Uncharacterized protein n=1 Tax=Hohenbuehelia grisea TaxID=104357 RepID=A0ABR3IUX0_9AGAR